MHELSIAVNIVDIACEEAERQGDSRVDAVYLNLGVLSGVVKEALLFSWELACEGTRIAGARLAIRTCRAGRCRSWPSKFSPKGIRRPFMTPRLVEVRKNVLKRNDELARALRERFRHAGVFVVSLVSSPGSGKTALLEPTLRTLWQDPSCGRTGGRSRHGKRCRPPVAKRGAGSPDRHRHRLPPGSSDGGACFGRMGSGLQLDILFIENVGNLVCPASYDLGEDLRLVLLSVTEGEDKPLKYPSIFNTADIAVITKIDLADAVEFDLEAADNILAVRPGMRIVPVSSKSGRGMECWFNCWRSIVRGNAPRRRRMTSYPSHERHSSVEGKEENQSPAAWNRTGSGFPAVCVQPGDPPAAGGLCAQLLRRAARGGRRLAGIGGHFRARHHRGGAAAGLH